MNYSSIDSRHEIEHTRHICLYSGTIMFGKNYIYVSYKRVWQGPVQAVTSLRLPVQRHIVPSQIVFIGRVLSEEHAARTTGRAHIIIMHETDERIVVHHILVFQHITRM